MYETERTLSFGYWLRRRRKALDLTQAELAQRVGCAVDTIKKIEADARRPSKQLAELLANELQIPASERASFYQAARGQRSSERLPLSKEPLGGESARAALPAFLVAPAPEPPEPSRFVSRERELAALDARLSAARQGNGQVVFITGEAGWGKTALMAEFARRAQAVHTDLIVAHGSCNAFAGIGDPYLPVRDVFNMLSGDVQSRWVAGAITQEHARRLWVLMPDTAAALMQHGPQLLNGFVSGEGLIRRLEASDAGDTRWRKELRAVLEREQARPADARQTQLLEQCTAVLRALAEKHPLMLLLDDLQWADDASINLLFHLGQRLAGSRIFIVGAYRSSDVATSHLRAPVQGRHPLAALVYEFIRRFGDIQIDLTRATTAEERAFVDALVDTEPNRLAQEFRAALFERTQGHPLFVVELLRDMQARGNLVRDSDGRWVQKSALDWNALPARVEAVVAQRIERLDAELRELLTVASVEGEGFSAQVLARALKRDEWQVLRHLSQELKRLHHLIVDRDEIVVGPQRVSRYSFAHVLFQQYLYQRLDAGERRALHGEIARALEVVYAEQLDEITAQLARHYAAAGEREKAADYLLRAGDRARTLYAHREAIEHYQRALQFLRETGDDERAARTMMKLGLTYNIGFDFEQARRAYQEGFMLWQNAEAIRAADLQTPAPHPFRLMWREPSSLDPTMGGWNMSASIATQLFSGLVAHSPEMEIVPDVARSWEIQEAGSRYVFHLRDDVYWTDGTRVTAHDFEFTFKRALDPAARAPVAGLLLYDVKGAQDFHKGRVRDARRVGVHALDDVTLVIELEEPSSYFIQVLSYYVLLPTPRHIVERHGAQWAEPENIVTNGAFCLAAWQRGEFMLLERNARYHGHFGGNIRQVRLTLNVDIAEHLELYQADQLDVVYNWFFAAVEMHEPVRRNSGEYISRQRFHPFYLFFSLDRPPFDDGRIRRAFTMAIDKEELSRIVCKGYEQPATDGFVPPGMPGHTRGIGLPFAPELARQLLAEANYAPSASGTEIILFTTQQRRALADFLVAQWRAHLQLDIKLEFVNSPLDALRRKEHGWIALAAWWADYADPDNFLRANIRLVAPAWHNDVYEQLLERARKSTAQSERMQLYAQADRLLMENAIVAPLLYSQSHFLLKPWVKTFPTAALTGPGFWKDVIIEPH